ncbi:hypothetical protein QYS49_13485 [Marivirga salinae]|uniref:Uncharacterized protein n=1 Tax=Marivirga salinarum TaxID=3059078 RepID=A0AA49GHM6_9BACT|nr:hypothetical protein [Marivirga sp. BDSF4-3]WKK77979.2 hypothetical protein QYS49_13485 [Marivirga sp. BDSF4-3]
MKLRSNIKHDLSLLALFLTFGVINLFPHSLKSQSVEFKSVDFPNDSHIPIAVGTNEKLIKTTNETIRNEFNISSLDPEKVENFNWVSLFHDVVVSEDVAQITFSGELETNTIYYIDREFFIDLETGKLIDPTFIPFHLLFKANSYFNFLEKYWVPGIKETIMEFQKCAGEGALPYCSFYDIQYGPTDNNTILLSLNDDDCVPRVIQACTPSYSNSIMFDSLKKNLNDYGRQVLINDQYLSMNRIEKLAYAHKTLPLAPKNIFITGKIDNKYSFKMGLQIKKDNTISGSYYYDSNKVALHLNGYIDDGEIYLKESHDGKITGRFKFKISNKYSLDAINYNDKYLTGNWSSPDKSKTYAIDFEDLIADKIANNY